jgi:hypothetical protein
VLTVTDINVIVIDGVEYVGRVVSVTPEPTEEEQAAGGSEETDIEIGDPYRGQVPNGSPSGLRSLLFRITFDYRPFCDR